MASVAATIKTGILARDMEVFDHFLDDRGLTNYHLFGMKNSIYLGIHFEVRGELMLYRLKDLEREFQNLHADTYLYSFVEDWDWSEFFIDDTGDYE